MRLIIAHPDRKERGRLREAAVACEEITLLGMARDGQEAVQMGVQYQPDVLVLNEELPVFDGRTAAGLLGAAAPRSRTVLLTREVTLDSVRAAMQVGVRECVERGASPEQVVRTALQVAERERIRELPQYQNALDPTRFTRLIAITGAKGGVGKTSLATNLAIELAAREPGSTCLMDLYTQFGDVATMLDVQPRQTLVDLARLPEIDDDVLKSAILEHRSGLHLVISSTTPVSLDAIPTDRLEQVFGILRRRYRFVLVDMPPVLQASTLYVMQTAHLVFLVCNLLDLTTVGDTRRLIQAIEQTFVARERLRLILNRVSRSNQLEVQRVQEALGLAPWAQIPEAERFVSDCINRGKPFILENPGHPASRAVAEAARLLRELPGTVEGTAAESPFAKRKRGFGRLLGVGAH